MHALQLEEYIALVVLPHGRDNLDVDVVLIDGLQAAIELRHALVELFYIAYNAGDECIVLLEVRIEKLHRGIVGHFVMDGCSFVR